MSLRVPTRRLAGAQGTDGRERGEDDTAFEKQTALFAMASADVLLVNMWCHDIGREHGAGKPLLKTARAGAARARRLTSLSARRGCSWAVELTHRRAGVSSQPEALLAASHRASLRHPRPVRAATPRPAPRHLTASPPAARARRRTSWRCAPRESMHRATLTFLFLRRKRCRRTWTASGVVSRSRPNTRLLR